MKDIMRVEVTANEWYKLNDLARCFHLAFSAFARGGVPTVIESGGVKCKFMVSSVDVPAARVSCLPSQISISEVRDVANKFGASFIRGGCDILIDAPVGKVWSASQTHVLRCAWDGTDGRNVAFADVIDRMNHGLDDCEESNCDICHPIYE